MAKDLIEFIQENVMAVFIVGLLCSFTIFYVANNNNAIPDDVYQKIVQTDKNISEYSITLEGSGYDFENLSKGADPEKSQSGVSKETVSGAFSVMGNGFSGIKKIYSLASYVLGENTIRIMTVFIAIMTFIGVLLALRHIFGKY